MLKIAHFSFSLHSPFSLSLSFLSFSFFHFLMSSSSSFQPPPAKKPKLSSDATPSFVDHSETSSGSSFSFFFSHFFETLSFSGIEEGKGWERPGCMGWREANVIFQQIEMDYTLGDAVKGIDLFLSLSFFSFLFSHILSLCQKEWVTSKCLLSLSFVCMDVLNKATGVCFFSLSPFLFSIFLLLFSLFPFPSTYFSLSFSFFPFTFFLLTLSPLPKCSRKNPRFPSLHLRSCPYSLDRQSSHIP